jgi:hypothetical protein
MSDPTKESGIDGIETNPNEIAPMALFGLVIKEQEVETLAKAYLDVREALKGVSSAYGDFAGCSAGTRNGASESEHTPACRQARAALGYR